MTDKLITHTDLPALKMLRDNEMKEWGPTRSTALLDRLIAAAEADAPPLPEGWVLHNTTCGYEALWHEDGALYRHNMLGGGALGLVGEEPYFLFRFTPLRPTVTEADVEKVAAEAGRQYAVGGKNWRDTMRLAFAAAGIEVV